MLRILPVISTLFAVIVFAALTVSFALTRPSIDIEKRLPGADNAGVQTAAARVNIAGRFKPSDGQPSSLNGSWPCFRGESFDNIVTEPTPLSDQWPETGPRVLWTLPLGDGHAGAAVRHGRVYLLDYNLKARADALLCLSLDDGKEIWRREYDVSIKRNHGMSRTVPTVNDRYVVSIGPKCQVLCADALTGDFKWGIDLVADYGATVPLWYTAQCPLVDGDTVVLAPGGPDALLIGVDIETGNVKWKTPNPKKWLMSHTCIAPMTFHQKRIYLYSAIGGIVGVSDDGSGRAILESDVWTFSVLAPTPVPLPDNRLFVTAGYGVGSAVLKIDSSGDGLSLAMENRLDRSQFACEQHTPVFYNGALFTVMPKDSGALRQQAVCMAPDGALLWSSGKDKRFGLGPFIIADGKMYILDDNGDLTMIRASTTGYEELGRVRIVDGRDPWAPLAIASGRLLLRDETLMKCLDISKP